MKSSFTIRFSGLKEGQHYFDFELNDDFFSQINYAEIERGGLKVEIEMLKHQNMLELMLEIDGTVDIPCDRCLEEMKLPIEAREKVVVKFGEEEDLEGEVIVLKDSAFEMDVSHLMYEQIMLNIPLKRVHPEDECDPEVLKRLSTEKQDVEDSDPRWEALKELKFNKDK